MVGMDITNLTEIMSNQTKMLERQCTDFCIRKFADAQYEAMAGIYDKYKGFMLSIAIYLFINKILETAIENGRKGYWRIGFFKYKKDIEFKLTEDTIKSIKFIKNMLFGIVFALTLVYYFVYGHLSGMGY